jgi:hypothetical protein
VAPLGKIETDLENPSPSVGTLTSPCVAVVAPPPTPAVTGLPRHTIGKKINNEKRVVVETKKKNCRTASPACVCM